jgi:membrane protein YdbS with pleckstrin-like domain
MINQMSSYFTAEKQESLIFMAIGLVAIGISAWLWMNGHRLKSMAWPLVAIALMQMVVGGSVYLRTDAQVSTLSAQLQTNPAALKAEETTRMQTVMKNFSIYKAVEMLLLIVGVGMVAFLQRHDMAAGIGVGLVLQAAVTLTLDIFAEARGADYLSALQSIPA